MWVVDPIDGTNFLYGMRYWCVSIANIERGVREVGAIYDPSQEELFLAAKEMGARCNGVPISVSTCALLDHAFDIARLRASARSRHASRGLPRFARRRRRRQGSRCGR